MFAVAIDGPAGAGKSSVAKAAAKELGFVYVDTGAIYRTIALHVLRQGVDPHDAPAVEALLDTVEGDEKTGCFLAGQIAGMVNKEQTAKEIIEEIFTQAEDVLKGATKWVK